MPVFIYAINANAAKKSERKTLKILQHCAHAKIHSTDSKGDVSSKGKQKSLIFAIPSIPWILFSATNSLMSSVLFLWRTHLSMVLNSFICNKTKVGYRKFSQLVCMTSFQRASKEMTMKSFAKGFLVLVGR